MNIIEKIEIKHFRSFDGGKDQVKVKIDNLKDLNVFSGANDSGKSNILRALNLFFNNEISPGLSFDKDRDFSKIVSSRFDDEIKKRRKEESKRVKRAEETGDIDKARDLRRSDEVVSIKVFFNNFDKQRGLPGRFWISRVYSQKNNFSGGYDYPSSLKGNAQVKLFLNSFRYEYVPAIKDKAYFNHLFEKLQTYLFEKEDKTKGNKFSKSSEDFNDILKSETKEIFDKFQKSSGVDASFHIPSTLVDFFRTLSVKTENDISLFDRGDGVQARFIPEILDEISKSAKKNIIWGFEEPENSYEAKNIRKIRDDFIEKYSKDKQIFITSHTKEYLAIERRPTKQEIAIENEKILDTKTKKNTAYKALKLNQRSSDISIYRVWRGEQTNYCSYITRFDENNSAWEETCDDLGLVQEARIIESLQEKLDKQAEEIANSSLTLEKQIYVTKELNELSEARFTELKDVKSKIEEYEKPILIVEDKYPAIYKIAYLKVNKQKVTLENYEQVFSDYAPFVIRRAEGARAVAGSLRTNNTDGYENKRVIGLFVFDHEGSENFYCLHKGDDWDKHIKGDKQSGFYKKRNQHPCFYGLLLTIPERHSDLVSNIKEGKFESYVEIENLLPNNVLTENNMVDEETILTTEYLKVKKDVKKELKQLLIKLPIDDFKDFKTLFDKIEKLFGIKQ